MVRYKFFNFRVKPRLYLVVLTLGVCFANWTIADSEIKKPITIYLNSSLVHVPRPEKIRAYRLIVQGFYDVGYEVSFSYLPPQRQIANVDDGQAGAICLRATGLEKESSSTLLIPVAVHYLQTYSYVSAKSAPVSGLWRDMEIDTLALLFGARLSERYVPKELLETHIVRTPDRLTSAKMVSVGRIDMVVFPEIVFHAYQSAAPKVISGLARLMPKLGFIETYCFLNEKYKDLVEPLGRSFKKLKQENPLQFDDKIFSFLISEDDMKKMPVLPKFNY